MNIEIKVKLNLSATSKFTSLSTNTTVKTQIKRSIETQVARLFNKQHNDYDDFQGTHVLGVELDGIAVTVGTIEVTVNE